MPRDSDIRIRSVELYFLPVELRVPLKFGDQVLESVTCARVKVRVENSAGDRAEGWGETPLSAAWVWPSKLPYGVRETRLKEFCVELTKALPETAFLVEAAADAEPHHWSDTVTDALASLKQQDLSRAKKEMRT